MARSVWYPTLFDIPKMLLVGKRRYEILESHGWYMTMTLGFADPHARDYMSIWEIRSLSPRELTTACENGSLSIPKLCDKWMKKNGW